jgi:quinoprotein glucose dehydrogenase
LGALLESSAAEVVVETVRLGTSLKLDGVSDLLRKSYDNRATPGPARAAMLRAMGELKDADLPARVESALGDADEALVRQAVRLLPQVRGADAAAPLLQLVREARWRSVRQEALTSLGAAGFDRPLAGLLESGVPKDLQLELLEATSKRPELKEKAASYQKSLPALSETLEGGDAAAGRRVFFERSDVQCVRCHQVGEQGGLVGPPLTKIAEQKSREYLLESIVTPNKQIAEGWGQVALLLQNGAVEVGRVEKETDAAVTLLPADGRRKTIAKGDIKARKAALSAMPEDIVKQLSRRDLRDLIEFLAGLK